MWLVSSILSPIASLAALARLPMDASLSLATSRRKDVVLDEVLQMKEAVLADELTLVGLLGSGGSSTLDGLRHVVGGVPRRTRLAVSLRNHQSR